MNESNGAPGDLSELEQMHLRSMQARMEAEQREALAHMANRRLNVATGLLAGLLSVKEPTITVDAEGNTLIAPSPEVAAGAALAYADELIRQAFK
jgi:hypothetical protein